MIEKRKKFAFRGIDIEQLKKLEVREFATYLRSRERRTLLRNFQEVEKFVSRAKEKQSAGKKIRTHSRYMVIVPGLVDMKIFVHNGNNFLPVEITTEMLGHRLGEFAPTRARIKHSKAGVGATKGTKHKSKK
jgi:small subunit ribosomal protein S19